MEDAAPIPIWQVRETMLDVVRFLRTVGLPGPSKCDDIADKLEAAANAQWLIGVPNPNAPEES